MPGSSASLLRRVVDRMFPHAPDFFTPLAEQSRKVVHTTTLMVAYMEDGEAEIGKEIRRDEHEADTVKVRNRHTLNEALSTKTDRQDIYRAIMNLDEVVNYCKKTVNEMDILEVRPDRYTREMAQRLNEGATFLAQGFGRLAETPAAAAADADAARKAERRVEKLYRKAIAELFQGDDYLNMLKRREIYRHVADAADRMARSANTLHDIVVKIG